MPVEASGKSRRGRALRLGAVVALAGVLLVVIAVGLVLDPGSLPDVRGLSSAGMPGDVIVQDRNGRLLADIGQSGSHRISVPLDQVSRMLQRATIAVEDPTFYENPGIDVGSGHATISEQLARQPYLVPDGWRTRLREAALAVQLNRTYSKRELLELYLNRADYGEQQHGAQAAARSYFHRDAWDLDLAQSALLAGLPRAATALDPVQHLDRARQRQREVLDAMVRDHTITSAQAAAAVAEHLDVFPPGVQGATAPHFVDYVASQLEHLGLGAGRQLVVKTTLDQARQSAAEQVVRDAVAARAGRDGTPISSSLVSLDPKTGEILAMVGSPDYQDGTGGQYDFAATMAINPGTSLFPFTYAKAIADHLASPDTRIVDGPSPFLVPLPGSRYTVTDFDRQSHGSQPLRVALGSGLNIPAIKVEEAVGVPALVDFYRSLGLRPRTPQGTDGPSSSYGPSLTLGGYPVTLLQEVAAEAVIADLGQYHEPTAILQVSDPSGNVLYRADPKAHARRVLDPGVAFLVASIMSDDANRQLTFASGSPLHLADRRAAAVAGTAESFQDAVAAGFTPDLASGVWLGAIDSPGPAHLAPPGDGISVASPAWHQFMEQALAGVPDRWYDVPADIVQQDGGYALAGVAPPDRLAGDG